MLLQRGFILLVATLAILGVFAAAQLQDLPPPITVEVAGTLRAVPQQTRVWKALHAFHIRATDGNLFDVEGEVIDPHAEVGQVLLNGAPADRSVFLQQGDRITVVNGVDRTEGTKRVTEPVNGRQPGNPQYFLGTAKMVQVTVEGRISGKILSLTYKPVGKFQRPPEVALTFDDGPWPGSTRKILKILKRMHVKATFFVIGYLAERYPALVELEKKMGMSIGNHSWDHPAKPVFDRLSPNRMRNEMSQVTDQLKPYGIAPSLFRPPGGSWDPDVREAARRLGMRLVLWDVDPRDWSSAATPKSIVQNVLSHVRPGSIIDMHDGGGDQSATIKALPKIIKGIRKMGFRLVVVGG
jgi:peptidoglycan/xylan/chitin deacetylase (PgdA/CDA1 family)